MLLSNAARFTQSDVEFMREAFVEAEIALEMGEVPVGCVFVNSETQKVFARGHNETNMACNATRHAEIMALGQLDSRDLPLTTCKCTVYVTLEPCIMCAGALAIAGVDRIVFGAFNDKFGGCGGVLHVARAFPLESAISSAMQMHSGLGEVEAIAMLQRFYMRANDKAPNPRPDGMKERLAKRQELL